MAIQAGANDFVQFFGSFFERVLFLIAQKPTTRTVKKCKIEAADHRRVKLTRCQYDVRGQERQRGDGSAPLEVAFKEPGSVADCPADRHSSDTLRVWAGWADPKFPELWV